MRPLGRQATEAYMPSSEGERVGIWDFKGMEDYSQEDLE